MAGKLRRLIPRLAALALACTLALPALAAPPRTLRFEQLDVDDGLAQESVLSIVQDRQGFMGGHTSNEAVQAALTDVIRAVLHQSSLVRQG